MAVLAGSIITVGGAHVIDRLQSAGLANVNMPIDVVREVGNLSIVDKIPMEPDFSFDMASLDVSCDLMAFLVGEVGAQASASEIGIGDAAHSGYSWQAVSWVNITSPWKDYYAGSAGTVVAGHLIPAYFPTKLSYSFGTTADAQQMVTLSGGEFYYAAYAPIEEFASCNGVTTTFVTAQPTVPHRLGSGAGTQYQYVYGVIQNNPGQPVQNRLLVAGADYTVTYNNANPAVAATANIVFTVAPANNTSLRYCYFTTTAQSWPDTVHTSIVVKPGAVRGRNILPWLWTGSARSYLYNVQSMTLDATAETTVTRELGSDKIIGRSIQGFDVKGSIIVQSKDPASFNAVLEQVTGVAATEVVGYFYQNAQPLGIDIENPKLPQTIIKTIFIPDAQIQPPGTPARVNTATDFTFTFESLSGTFSEYRGGISGYGTPSYIEF